MDILTRDATPHIEDVYGALFQCIGYAFKAWIQQHDSIRQTPCVTDYNMSPVISIVNAIFTTLFVNGW